MKNRFLCGLITSAIFLQMSVLPTAAEQTLPPAVKTDYTANEENKNENIVTNPYSANGYNGSGAKEDKYSYATVSEDYTGIIFKRQSEKIKPWEQSGGVKWDPFGIALSHTKGNISESLSINKNYVVSLWLKNTNPDVPAVDFSIGNGYNSYYGDRARWTVENTEWQEFKGIINAKNRENVNDITLGLPDDYDIDNASVMIATTRDYYTYIAEEQIWDFDVALSEEAQNITAVQGGSFTADISFINQIGLPLESDAGEITWYVLNAERNAVADGITAEKQADGSALVTVSNTAAAGKYYIAAYSKELDGAKAAEINVLPMSAKTAEKPDNLIIAPESFYGYQTCGATEDKYTYTRPYDGKYDMIFTRQSDKEKSLSYDPFGIALNANKLTQIPEADKNYVVSLWLKNGNPDIPSVDFAVRSGYNVGYGSALKWSVTDTEWQKYTGIITPKRSAEIILGLPNDYNENGASVILGASEKYQTYIAEEIPYAVAADITGSTIVCEGHESTFEIKPMLLNNAEFEFSGEQGGFGVYAATEDGSRMADGISVNSGDNGGTKITVGKNVKPGVYKLFVKSLKYDLCSEIKIVVSPIEEYVPKNKPENIIIEPENIGTYVWCGGGYRMETSEDADTNEKKLVFKRDSERELGFWVPDGCDIQEQSRTKAIENGKNYVVSARVKKLAPENGKDVMFAVGIGRYGADETTVAEQKITDGEYNEFKQVIKVGETQFTKYLKFGVPLSETQNGVSVEMDLSKGYEPYVAEEILYDIQNEVIDGSNVVVNGKGGSFTAKASLVNQIGLPTEQQGSFAWLAVDADGDLIADGIEVVPDGNTAKITVNADMPKGVYRVAAVSAEHEEMCRSVYIYVTDEDKNITVYVSENGNDTAVGTAVSPLKTIDAAKQRVADICDVEKKCTVELSGGEYRLSKSLFFGKKDSGTQENPVVYKSNGDTAVIKGSVRLNGSAAQLVTDETVLAKIHQNAKGKIYEIDLAAQGLSQKDIFNPEQAAYNSMDLCKYGEYNGFYVDGEEQSVAHWPNGRHYARFSDWETDLDDDKSNDNWSNGTADEFYYPADETEPEKWTNAKNWWVASFPKNDYAFGRMMVAEVVPEENKVRLAQNVFSTGGYYKLNVNRWQAWNLLEEADIPGEYYIDRDAMKLYFYPPYDITNSTLELSVMSQPMLQLRESHDIVFENIKFTQTRYHAAELVDVDNVDFKNCKFYDISGRAISISGSEWAKTQENVWQRSKINGSYNMDISGCDFYNIGSSAIDMSGGNVDTLTPSGNVIENNFFCRTAQKHFWLAETIMLRGDGVTVKNNEFAHIPSQAIRIWGNDHTVEYNEFYDVIQEVTDAGAIYRERNEAARGDEIRYNYFHDFDVTDNFWEHAENLLSPVYRIGLYWDGSQQGCIGEKNIFKNISADMQSTGTSAQIYRYNTAIDITQPMRFTNTLYETGDVTKSIYGTAQDVADSIYDLTLYYEKYPVLKSWIEDGTNPLTFTEVKENLIVNTKKQPSFSTATLENATVDIPAVQETCEDFVDPANQDYRLKSGSPTALAMPDLLNEDNFADIHAIGIQREITLNDQTAPFKLIYPANGQQTDTSSDIEFVWQEAYGATKYRLLIADNPELKNPIVNSKTEFNSQTVAAGTLENGKAYYWQVYASNPSLNHTAEWKSISGVYCINPSELICTFDAEKTSDGVRVTGGVKNSGGAYSEDIFVYIAMYNTDGSLCYIRRYTKPSGADLELNENIPCGETSEIKMFIWNGVLSPQKPYCAIPLSNGN